MGECSRYNYRAQFHPNFDTLLNDLGAMLLRGDYVLSSQVNAFEREFAKFNGSAFCLGVNSGTDALLIVLRSLGIGPGDEVITHANTFYATVAAIELTGAKAVLVDADDQTFLVDVEALRAALTPRTRAIIPVHLYGKPTPMKEILALSSDKGLVVVEDAAQAHGARIDGERVGTFGIAGCFSFHPSKNLAAAGDAGAIVTNDATVATRVEQIRALGQREPNDHVAVGYNSKLDSLQARILSYKLEHLDAWNAQRRRVAALYREALSNIPVSFQRRDAGEEHVYHQFQIRSEYRDDLLAHLKRNGVDAVVRYPVPIHLQPAFHHHGWRVGQFPVAERLAKELLCLPIRPDLTEADVAFVSGCVRSFFDHRTALTGAAVDETTAGTARRQTRCAVCNGASDVIVLRENGYEGRKCACGTIYVSPEPSLEEIDRTFNGHHDAFYDFPAALKARWVRTHTSGHDLLEVGCGTGSFLEAAQASGFHVEGIEAEATRAAVAASRVNGVVHAGFFEDLKTVCRFDVVYHCDMLSHFERPAEALRLMTEFLRPGGVLAFEVGFVADLPRFWYSWIGEIGYPEHRWLFSQRSLHRLLHAAGLGVEHIKVFDLSACVASLHGVRTAVRLVRRLTPRRRSAVRDSGGGDGRRGSGRALLRCQNILRYRVGAWLPRLGPATALVIARPVEGRR